MTWNVCGRVRGCIGVGDRECIGECDRECIGEGDR